MSTPTPGSRPAKLSDHGEPMPFAKVASALARGLCADAGAMRALMATLVAVGPIERLDTAAGTLKTLGDAGTVRGILIAEGNDPAPPARVTGNIVMLCGLTAPYINNAVAALRLSSLPTLVWWRGGRPETLDGLADLADRIVLDEDAPHEIWRHAITLFDDSAFSDMRWARLTQWRALMAHFFEIPEVRIASRDFTHLHVAARDKISASLFAAWLTTSLRFSRELTVEIVEGDMDAPIQQIELGNGDQRLTVRLAAVRNCLETEVEVRGHRSASRIVALRDQGEKGLLTEELRIRARDLAFERAVRALVERRTTSAVAMG